MANLDNGAQTWRNWDWWNRHGCLGFVGSALGLMAIVGAGFYAWQEYTDDLLFIIICLLTILVILKATEGWQK
jgi:hypothetical protein